jgi:uncharacterized protein involved in outer membrane biogenesis
VFRVQWLALLVGELVPASVALEDWQLALRRSPPARTGLRGRPARLLAAATNADDSAPGARQEGLARQAPAVSLRVTDGRVTYKDGESDYRVGADQLTGSARLRRHGRAWLAEGLELNGRLKQQRLAGGPLAFRLRGTLAADPQGVRVGNGRLQAAGIRLRGSGAWEAGQGRVDVQIRVRDGQSLGRYLRPWLPAELQPAALTGGEGRLRGRWEPGSRTAEAVRLDELRLRAAGLAIALQGRGGWPLPEAQLQGHVETAVTDEKALKRFLSGAAGPLPARVWQEGRVSGDFHWQRGKMRLEPLQVRLAGVAGSGRVSLGASGAGPILEGHWATEQFDPRRLAKDLGTALPATRDDSALRQARLEADFGTTPGSLTLAPFSLALDGARLGGEVAYRWGEGPVVRFNVTGDRLDLDRYRPADTASLKRRGRSLGRVRLASTRPVAVDAPLRTSIPAWVRALDVAGRLRLGRLTVAGLTATNLDAAVRGREGRFRAVPLRADLHGGRVDGSLDLSANEAHPHWTLDLGWSGVDLAPLQRALLPRVRLRGSSRGSVTLEADGWRPRQAPRSWSGDGRWQVADGAVLGLDLAHRLSTTLARLQGQTPPEAPAQATTAFESLEGRFYIDRGRLHVTELRGESEWLSADGRGKADLVDRRLSGQVELTVTAAPPGMEGTILRRLQGVSVPLRVQGTLDEPRVGLNLAPVLRSERGAEAARELRRRKERLRQETEEQLKDLEKRLQNLLD